MKRYDRNHEPSSYAGQQLRDPKTYIYYKYHIIIGRRDKINEETRNLMSRIKYQDDIDIRTYDRILDVAKNLEKC